MFIEPIILEFRKNVMACDNLVEVKVCIDIINTMLVNKSPCYSTISRLIPRQTINLDICNLNSF